MADLYAPKQMITTPAEIDLRASGGSLDPKLSKKQRVPHSLRTMQLCLAEGMPFLVDINVYSGFDSSEIVTMPSSEEEAVETREVACVGYKMVGGEGRWIVRKNWGSKGDGEYAYLPWMYLLEGAFVRDIWTLEKPE